MFHIHAFNKNFVDEHLFNDYYTGNKHFINYILICTQQKNTAKCILIKDVIG